jgi:hypothetical protein
VATCALPLPPSPANGTDTPAAPIVEREEVAGLPLWPSPYAGGLLLALTSTGAADLMGTGAAASFFGPDAIAVNGLGVAVGTRGLNVVVIDLARGVLERSVAIDAALGGPDGDNDGAAAAAAAAASAPVQAALARFLAQVPEGRMVVAVVLGSAHALGGAGTDDAAVWGQGGFPSLRAPGRGQAWVAVGEKDGGPTLKPWTRGVVHEEGKGPARLVFTVPLPAPPASAASGEGMRWTGGIAALPLLHDMGPAGDGVVGDVEAALARVQAMYPGVPVCGHSHKPGFGLVVFGPTSGIRGGAGWTSVRAPAASSTSMNGEVGEKEEEDVKVRMKRAFDQLVADGLEPNAAAVQALVVVKQEVREAQE